MIISMKSAVIVFWGNGICADHRVKIQTLQEGHIIKEPLINSNGGRLYLEFSDPVNRQTPPSSIIATFPNRARRKLTRPSKSPD